MKIGIDRNFTFKVTAEDVDITNIKKLENAMKTDEFQFLVAAYAVVHEEFLKLIREVSNSQMNERAAWIKASVFKGFDETASLPEKILRAGAELLEEQKHDGENDESDAVGAGWRDGGEPL